VSRFFLEKEDGVTSLFFLLERKEKRREEVKEDHFHTPPPPPSFLPSRREWKGKGGDGRQTNDNASSPLLLSGGKPVSYPFPPFPLKKQEKKKRGRGGGVTKPCRSFARKKEKGKKEGSHWGVPRKGGGRRVEGRNHHFLIPLREGKKKKMVNGVNNSACKKEENIGSSYPFCKKGRGGEDQSDNFHSTPGKEGEREDVRYASKNFIVPPKTEKKRGRGGERGGEKQKPTS